MQHTLSLHVLKISRNLLKFTIQGKFKRKSPDDLLETLLDRLKLSVKFLACFSSFFALLTAETASFAAFRLCRMPSGSSSATCR